MDSYNLIQAIRLVIADDSTMRTLMGESDAAGMKTNRLFYKDAIYARKKTTEYSYPHLTFLLDYDKPMLEGADDNFLSLEVTVVNYVKEENWIKISHQCVDRLNLMFSDKKGVNPPNVINAKALTFSVPVTLKVRRVSWVSGTVYDDKEQGSERRHKIICLLKLTVGD